MPLLDHAGEILSETTGARRGGSGFWGDEIQVFIIGDLVKMVPVLQQLPAQVLVHLLRGTKWGSAGWTHSHALWGDASSPCAEPRGVRGTREPMGDPAVAESKPRTCLSGGVSRGTPGSWLPVTEGRKKQSGQEMGTLGCR